MCLGLASYIEDRFLSSAYLTRVAACLPTAARAKTVAADSERELAMGYATRVHRGI